MSEQGATTGLAMAEIEAAWDAIALASSRTRAHDRWVARAGVSVDRAGAALLRQLGASHEALRVSDLAERLQIDAPGVTRKVQQLERAGLVERSPDDDDRRTVRLRLSWVGEGVLARLLNARRAQLAEVLWGWEEHDRETFASLLRRFAQDIVAASEASR